MGVCTRLNTFGVLDESGTMRQCHRKVASERKVTGAIRSLVNVRGL